MKSCGFPLGNIGIVVSVILIATWLMILPCMAAGPLWTYPYDNKDVHSIVIAPDGSYVIAGAGKILVFTRDGTLVQKAAYGDEVVQTPDGSSVATAYSASVYMFSMTTDASNRPILQKRWEADLPDQVGSISMDDFAYRVAALTKTGAVTVYNGTSGEVVGRSTNYSAVLAVSPYAYRITGLSLNEGLKIFNYNGEIDRENAEIQISSQPTNLVAIDEGVFVYNDGQNIVAINTTFPENGTQVWKAKINGFVNVLAQTTGHDYIVVGTENGSVELFSSDGDRIWSYQSRTGTGSSQGIRDVAITSDASRILAGSYDGKVIMLDNNGNALWTYTLPKEHIWHVAIASGGSLAAAAGDRGLYVFLPDQDVATVTDTPTPVPSSVEQQGGPEASPSPSSAVVTPKTTSTEYAIIRTAKTPLSPMTTVFALLLILSFVCLRRGSG